MTANQGARQTEFAAAPEGLVPRMGRALVAVVAVALMIVALTAWISAEDSPVWGALIFALTTVGSIGSIVLLTRTWTDRRVWIGAGGVVLIAIGSGIGRSRTEHEGPYVEGVADVVARLDTWWPVVVVGIALVVTAFVGMLRTSRRAPTAATLAGGSLFVMGLGYLAVTVLMRDLVVGQWISGRPVRGRRRTDRSRHDEHHGGTVGDLWLDAAQDEAEAIAAFSDLADRLGRVGAPELLVERSHDAARDEARHVRVCERVATGLGQGSIRGASEHARAEASSTDRKTFSRRSEVARLAVESFVDGVVGEGFAARRLASGSNTFEGRGALAIRSMAREEAGHAALGADIVEWALRKHPLLVAGALRNAARRLPRDVALPVSHRQFARSELRRAGLVDAETADELWSEQRADALDWLDEIIATGA